jgi:hypothetical protein
MKLFAFLMAFLVLALSIMPCADRGDALSSSKAKTELAKKANPQSDPQQDDCTPFCHCTCCACFSINHTVATIGILPVYSAQSQTAHLPSNLIDVALPIWQPPQLLA